MTPPVPDRDHVAAITTRGEFQDAIRRSLAWAASVGSPEIFLFDADFADWPLGERAVIESLSSWAHSRRRLTLMAYSFDSLASRQTRFVEWRRQWAHVMQCRHDAELEAEQIPALLLVPGLVSVQLVDRIHYRGTHSSRAIDEVTCRERIDALLQRSTEAFPATTLGL